MGAQILLPLLFKKDGLLSGNTFLQVAGRRQWRDDYATILRPLTLSITAHVHVYKSEKLPRLMATATDLCVRIH